MRSAVVLIALVAAGCPKRDPDTASTAKPEAAPAAPAADSTDAAPIATAPPPDAAPPPDCDLYHRALAGMVGRALRAASGQAYYQRAADRWKSAHSACRDSRWHRAAAQLLRYDPTPLDAGGARFAEPSEALAAGLAGEPGLELLTLVAYLAPLDRGPDLPADACARARAAPPVDGPDYETADRIAYVCGHAALAAGDWKTAASELAAITMSDRYPDLQLRRARAEACAGRRSKARRHAYRARKLDAKFVELFGGTVAEYEQLIKAAKEPDLRRGRCAE